MSKIWVIESRGHEGDGKMYWRGGDYDTMTTRLVEAVWFVREADAKRTLDYMPLFRGKPVEVERPPDEAPTTSTEDEHG